MTAAVSFYTDLAREADFVAETVAWATFTDPTRGYRKVDHRWFQAVIEELAAEMRQKASAAECRARMVDMFPEAS